MYEIPSKWIKEYIMIKDNINGINFSIKDISEYEVWNGKKWCSFTGIMEKDISNLVIIEFSDGSNIAGSLHHKIEVSENIFKRLEDISINDKINNLIVTNIIITNDKNKLYDLLDVEHENKYQTNNIISHNCAFIYDVDKTWTAAQQTIATGGRAIVLSTPNGVGNWFHQMWIKAVEGENGFNHIKIKWNLHPERDQKWRDKQTKELGTRMAAQECLAGESIITVKNIETDEIFEIKIEDLYEKMHINNKYEILTPNGFESFDGIQLNKKEKYFDISFKNNANIKCSLDHKFIIDNKKIYAKDLNTGDFLELKNKKIKIQSIKLYNDKVNMFDIINSGKDHCFYANDILSSNCDADFASSGNTVLDPEILKWYNENTVKKPVEKRRGRNLWIWKEPEIGKSYIIGADVARGDGSDYSAFHVLEVETLEQVAEFKGLIDTQVYGNLLVSIATEYNDALLVVENASMGWATIQAIIEKDYKNLYYTYKDLAVLDINMLLSKGYDKVDKEKMVPGFTTSRKTRPLIIEKMERFAREKELIIRSERLYNELTTFIWYPNGKPEAQQGANDDLVMSFSIALWIRETALKLRMEGIKMQKVLISHIGKKSYADSDTSLIRKNNLSYDPYKYVSEAGHEIDLKQFIK